MTCPALAQGHKYYLLFRETSRADGTLPYRRGAAPTEGADGTEECEDALSSAQSTAFEIIAERVTP